MKILASVIVLTFVGFLIGSEVINNVEQPKYEVLSQKNNIEIRKYEPNLIAEVKKTGNRKEAISAGFKDLADFIFGNNKSSDKILMTAPVQQSAGESISMTAPVQQLKQNDEWLISFVMPSNYQKSNLPLPNNPNVKIIEIPSKKYATIVFSGTNSNENVYKHEKELEEFIKENALIVTGVPKYAFYNHPLTLPFMRRNEVLIEIK
jgi:effector-binding domain-containing protein